MATTKSKTTKKTTAAKSTSTKSTTAKTVTVKTNKAGKKIVKAAPLPEHKTASAGGGLDVGGLLSGVLGSLAGGGSEGSDETVGMGGLLSGVLGALTGDGNGQGGGLNVASIAEMLLPLLSGDGGLIETFKKHPTKTIEKLIGIDLPDDKIDPVVEMVLDRLGHSK